MSAGGRDFLEALLWLGAFIVGLGAIVGVVVWRGRRRGSRTIALDAALTVSAWWLVLALLALAMQVIATLTSQEVTLMDARVTWSASSPVPCGPPPEGTEAASLTCLSPSGADVTIAGLSAGARALLAAGQILTAALGALPAALLATITWQALRGAPFSRTVIRALYVGAAVVLVTGIGAAVLSALAESVALAEVLPSQDVSPSFFRVSVDPVIFVSALALGALGSVFQHGTRLQRDTEGLV